MPALISNRFEKPSTTKRVAASARPKPVPRRRNGDDLLVAPTPNPPRLNTTKKRRHPHTYIVRFLKYVDVDVPFISTVRDVELINSTALPRDIAQMMEFNGLIAILDADNGNVQVFSSMMKTKRDGTPHYIVRSATRMIRNASRHQFDKMEWFVDYYGQYRMFESRNSPKASSSHSSTRSPNTSSRPSSPRLSIRGSPSPTSPSKRRLNPGLPSKMERLVGTQSPTKSKQSPVARRLQF
jgi:hypothetical protein